MSKKRIAIIDWIDASMFGNSSQHEKDCRKYKLMKIKSVGIIIRETKKFITLGMDYCPEYRNYRDVNVYPKSGIRKIRRIKL